MESNVPADAPQMQTGNVAGRPTKAGGKLRLLTLGHLDGRTAAARRARELIDTIEADLGGDDRLSEGTKQLVQRAACLGVYVESCEAAWLGGQDVPLGDYLAAINSQRRVLATIGLQRMARDVPTLAEHLAKLAREPSPPDEEIEDEETAADPEISEHFADESEAGPIDDGEAA